MERESFNPDQMAASVRTDAESVPEAWNVMTREVIGSAMTVHSALGPGLPERQYEDAMMVELAERRLDVDRQRAIRLEYKGRLLSPMCLDLVVGGLIVVELKAVETVHPAHLSQLTSYLRASELPLGVLLNFGALRIKDGLHRRLNPASPLLISHRRRVATGEQT